MAILILQHAAHCGPGRLGACLRDHGFKVDLRRLDLPADDIFNRGKPPRELGVPGDFDNVHAVISLGGPQNVGDDVPWMKAELEFLREAHRRQLPVVGICLGHQMIAAALGGQVGPMDKPEVGYHEVALNPAGQTEVLLQGIAWNSPQYESHGQEVKQLPAGATLLASSKMCKVQAFKAGVRTYGVQWHPELDTAMIAELEKCEAGLSQWAHSAAAAKGQAADASYQTFARLSDRLCVNIATLMLPSAARMSA